MPLKTQTDEQPGLNLTPMIDVVFLLIIFFMVATKFSELERDIDLTLPEVSDVAELSTTPKTRQIAVQSDGAISIEGRIVELDELVVQLREDKDARPDLSVVIRGDATCEYQHVAAALAACREAHVADVSVSVRLAGGGSTRR